MKDVRGLLNHNIDTNFKLEEEGKKTIAFCFEAAAGIGKTSIVQQVAEERGMQFTKVNLAQFDEPGDITGYPQVEYECQVAKLVKGEDGKPKAQILPGTVWLNNKQLESADSNTKFRQTGKTRMGYAKPTWVPEYCENGNLVLIDDFTRANPSILTAAMDLIYEKKYMSWKFPKKTVLCLTTNPDNGEYSVNAQDEAQRTRYIPFSVEFSLDSWAQWAEKNKLDGRCINFVLSYSNELFNADEEGNRICNPRSFEMFANMISTVKDWNDPESLAFINLIARGCFKDDQGRFANMFSAFIRNKMHLLIQPKKMLEGSWDSVKDILEKTLYDGENHRPDIAQLLEKRFTNYVNAWLDSDEKTPISVVRDRIMNFIENPDKGGKKLFTPDMFYHMLKSITSDHRGQTNKLLYEPKIAKILS